MDVLLQTTYLLVRRNFNFLMVKGDISTILENSPSTSFFYDFLKNLPVPPEDMKVVVLAAGALRKVKEGNLDRPSSRVYDLNHSTHPILEMIYDWKIDGFSVSPQQLKREPDKPFYRESLDSLIDRRYPGLNIHVVGSKEVNRFLENCLEVLIRNDYKIDEVFYSLISVPKGIFFEETKVHAIGGRGRPFVEYQRGDLITPNEERRLKSWIEELRRSYPGYPINEK